MGRCILEKGRAHGGHIQSYLSPKKTQRSRKRSSQIIKNPVCKKIKCSAFYKSDPIFKEIINTIVH
jgi:hypothetical protein